MSVTFRMLDFYPVLILIKDKEADFCGKPPPLLSQPTQTNKVMYASIDKTPQHNVEIKMEQVDTSFAIKVKIDYLCH